MPLAGLGAAAILAPWAFGYSAAVPKVVGNAAAGKRIFVSSTFSCYMCHTLSAAGATGTRAPNLDKVKPAYATIIKFVTNGRKQSARYPTGMPTYGGPLGPLSKQQIQDLAAFIYTSTRK